MIYSKMPTANESAELVSRIREEEVVIREKIIREEIISGIKKASGNGNISYDTKRSTLPTSLIEELKAAGYTLDNDCQGKIYRIRWENVPKG